MALLESFGRFSRKGGSGDHTLRVPPGYTQPSLRARPPPTAQDRHAWRSCKHRKVRPEKGLEGRQRKTATSPRAALPGGGG